MTNSPIVIGASNISSIDFLVPLMWKTYPVGPKVVVVINGDLIKKTNKESLVRYLYEIKQNITDNRVYPASKANNENINKRFQYFIDFVDCNEFNLIDMHNATIQSLFLHTFYRWIGVNDISIVDINKPIRQDDDDFYKILSDALENIFSSDTKYRLSNGRSQILFLENKHVIRCSKIDSNNESIKFILENGLIYRINRGETYHKPKYQSCRFYNATGDLSFLFLIGFGSVGHCPWYLKKNTTANSCYSHNFLEFITPFSLLDQNRIEFREDFFIPVRRPGAFLWDYSAAEQKQFFTNSLLRVNEPYWVIEILACLLIRRKYDGKKRLRRARLAAQVVTIFYYKMLLRSAHKILHLSNNTFCSKDRLNIMLLVQFISLILLFKKRYHPYSNFEFKQSVKNILRKNEMGSFQLFSKSILSIAESISTNYFLHKSTFTEKDKKIIDDYNKILITLKNTFNCYQEKQFKEEKTNIINNINRILPMFQLILTDFILNIWEKIEDNAIASPINLLSNFDKDVLFENVTKLSKMSRKHQIIRINLKSLRCIQ